VSSIASDSRSIASAVPDAPRRFVPHVKGGGDGAVGAATGLTEHRAALAQDSVDVGHERVEAGVDAPRATSSR